MPMRTAVLVAVLTLATAAMRPPALAADAPRSFRSVDIDLPFGDLAPPPGPGVEAFTSNCLACHSVEMVLTQPPLPRAVWRAEVQKMRAAFAAPIADDDAKQIVDYLAQLKGSD